MPKNSWPRTPEQIAEELQGTCKSLYEMLEYYDMEDLEMDSEFCARLDQEIFLCEGCGWWCEMCEMTTDEANDWQCTDCAPDEGDDDYD